MPTPDDFRRIALSFPGAEEGGHMGHADFRVGGKIFATLGAPDDGLGHGGADARAAGGFHGPRAGGVQAGGGGLGAGRQHSGAAGGGAGGSARGGAGGGVAEAGAEGVTVIPAKAGNP